MAAPFAVKAAAFATTFALNFTSNGIGVITGIVKSLLSLRKSLFRLGVTTIFLDRLMLSLTRGWKAFSETLGATRVSKHAADLDRLATVTGIGVEQLQAFSGAARAFGADLNDVSDLFQTLNERIDDLRSGQEKGIMEDFLRFGMTAKTFEGTKNPLEQFVVFADVLSKMGKGKSLSALEKLLGGDLARKFGIFASLGAQGILDMMQVAIDSGAVLSEQQIKHAERFRLEQERFALVMEGLSNQVAQIFIPALSFVTGLMSVLVKDVARLVRGQVMRWSRFLLIQVIAIGQKLMEIVNLIEQKVMPFGEFVVRLTQGMIGLASAIGAVFGGRIVSGALFLAGVFVGLAIIAEDILVAMREGDSFLQGAVKSSPILANIWTAIQHAAASMVFLFESIKDLMVTIVTSQLVWSNLIHMPLETIAALAFGMGLFVKAIEQGFIELEKMVLLAERLLAIMLRLFSINIDEAFWMPSVAGLSTAQLAREGADLHADLNDPFWRAGRGAGLPSDVLQRGLGPDVMGLLSSGPAKNISQSVVFNNQVSGTDPGNLAKSLMIDGRDVIADNLEGAQ